MFLNSIAQAILGILFVFDPGANKITLGILSSIFNYFFGGSK